MKITLPPIHRHRAERGVALLVVLILIVLMVFLVAANTITVNSLASRVKLEDKSQIRRLVGSVTNAPLSK